MMVTMWLGRAATASASSDDMRATVANESLRVDFTCAMWNSTLHTSAKERGRTCRRQIADPGLPDDVRIRPGAPGVELVSHAGAADACSKRGRAAGLDRVRAGRCRTRADGLDRARIPGHNRGIRHDPAPGDLRPGSAVHRRRLPAAEHVAAERRRDLRMGLPLAEPLRGK